MDLFVKRKQVDKRFENINKYLYALNLLKSTNFNCFSDVVGLIKEKLNVLGTENLNNNILLVFRDSFKEKNVEIIVKQK